MGARVSPQWTALELVKKAVNLWTFICILICFTALSLLKKTIYMTFHATLK